MRNIIRLQDIQSLLQIHSRTERLLARSSEHCAAQLGFCVVPFPQRAQLDGGFYGEAVHVFGAVDGYEEDVFGGEGDEGVVDSWVRRFYPGGHGVFGAGGCHFGELSVVDVHDV